MKEVQFIKDHESGAKKGDKRSFSGFVALGLKDQGFVEIIGEDPAKPDKVKAPAEPKAPKAPKAPKSAKK